MRNSKKQHNLSTFFVQSIDIDPTVAIASGADIKSVQDLLGHATASFTLNVYAHTSEQMMKDTAARMQSYYDGLAAKG